LEKQLNIWYFWVCLYGIVWLALTYSSLSRTTIGRKSFRVFVIASVLFTLGIFAYEALLEYRLAEFDLNRDRVISESEKTEGYSETESSLSSDTGRKLALVAGPVLYGVVSLLVFVVAKVTKKRGRS
jgi:hypothetical protein